jgi:hypothetical protein
MTSTSDTRIDDLIELDPAERASLSPSSSFTSILGSTAEMDLTNEESMELLAFQRSLIILGPAGGAVLMCPGNQVNVRPEDRCPYAAKCPLLRAQKAPNGKLCPIERTITEQRFSSWARTVGQEPDDLTEDARATVSQLTYIDLQEQRCTNILSTAEAARLTQTNVTEAINFSVTDANGNQTQEIIPLTWERVLHINAELLAQLQERRRMILKDWMLTPEQKWKIAKAEGKAKGNDIGTQQSARGDKLRKLDPDFL